MGHAQLLELFVDLLGELAAAFLALLADLVGGLEVVDPQLLVGGFQLLEFGIAVLDKVQLLP